MRDSLDSAFALVVAIIAVLVCAGAAAVVRIHARAERIAPRSHGLLVWHIVAIAGGTAGTWAFILLGQLDIMGLFLTPRPFRLAGYSICGLLTIIAIFIIAVSGRRRVTQTSGATTVQISTEQETKFRD